MRLVHPRPVLGLLGILLALVAPLLVAPAAVSAASPVPTLTSSCVRDSTTPSAPIQCWVNAAPAAGYPTPTGFVSFSVASTKGYVSPGACSVPCGFIYTPKGIGSATRKDTVTATYHGDYYYGEASTTVVIKVLPAPPPAFSFACSAHETTPGLPVSCEAVVYQDVYYDPAPHGTVTFTVPSYKGSVTPTSCPINGNASCTITYIPTGNGSASRHDDITAAWSGDSFYVSAKRTATIFVGPKPVPVLTFSCPSSTTSGQAVSCFATISGQRGSVTNAIAVTVPSYKGTLAFGGYCYPQSSGWCSVSYTPKGTGTATRKDTLTAKYPGDYVYAPAKATATISVHAP